MPQTTVLITGASGFIATHTVQALVRRGYNVVGSVRSEEKGEYVRKACGIPSLFSYEIVKDMTEEGAFDDFVRKHSEATVFLHTASPFSFTVTDFEKELLKPAINGTKNVFQSIKKYGKNIKRVVLTSSYAAIATANLIGNPQVTFDESSWNETTWEESLKTPHLAYRGSKLFAEKEAWDFVRNEKPNFALTTVCPCYTLGPQPVNEFDTTELNLSCETINSIMKIKDPSASVTPVIAYAVDVRDVAKAHIAGFERDEAKNERLFMATSPFTHQTILDVLHLRFPDQMKDVPVGKPGSAAEDIKTKSSINNERTRKILGFELGSVDQAIADCAQQILEVEGKL